MLGSPFFSLLTLHPPFGVLTFPSGTCHHLDLFLVFHCGQDLTNEPSDSCVSQTIGRIRARPEADGNGLETTAQTMLKAYLCLDTLHG